MSRPRGGIPAPQKHGRPVTTTAAAALRVEEAAARIDAEGETWEHLVEVAARMEQAKYHSSGQQRNTWQMRQQGGKGEPFYRDAAGFEIGISKFIATGRQIFAEKWGHRGCDIGKMGIVAEDAWQLQIDWDPREDGNGAGGPDW